MGERSHISLHEMTFLAPKSYDFVVELNKHKNTRKRSERARASEPENFD